MRTSDVEDLASEWARAGLRPSGSYLVTAPANQQDHQTILAHLVEAGFAEAVLFSAKGPAARAVAAMLQIVFRSCLGASETPLRSHPSKQRAVLVPPSRNASITTSREKRFRD